MVKNGEMGSYHKNTFYRRRQHSSYKNHQKVKDDLVQNQSFVSQNLGDEFKEPKSDREHARDGYFLRRKASEDPKIKHEDYSENLHVQNSSRSKNAPVESTEESTNQIAKESEKPSESNQENQDDSREKPWVVYLRTLRIPIICPIHRKLFLMISDNFRSPEISEKKKKNNVSAITSMKRVTNRNPN